MLRSHASIGTVFLGIALCFGCDAPSDPAVRVAKCLEAASHRGEAVVKCDLKLEGRSVTILHPSGPIQESALQDLGVPGEIIAELRTLRLGPQEAVYVIPMDNQDSPSRTTYQARFVSIPKLLVKIGRDSSATLVLAKGSGRPAVVEVR